MITARHVRAARESLGWSQTHLARKAGVAQATISALEREETDAPNSATLAAIKQVFEAEGVVFTRSGIEWRAGATYEISGEGWWLKVIDDVYDTLIDRPNAEVIFLCADDRESPPDVVYRLRKLRNAGMRFRQFVREGNTFLSGPVTEYRWMPKERFLNNVTLVYGDKIAACAEDNTKAVIVKDRALATSWRNVVDLLWASLEQPNESTADVRF